MAERLLLGVSALIGAILVTFWAPSSLARTEYSAKEKLSCTACHVTPWGGGPRNVFGKTYGNHGYSGSLTSTNDLFYGDLRSIAYFTGHATERTTGVATMAASATANVPVVRSEDGGNETRAVVTYNIAPLSGAYLREGYLRLQHGKSHATVGHFYVPFGLLTDEHRTYTRIQTHMTENDFDTGAALSGEFLESFHLDFALVNDFQSGGSLNQSDVKWGGVFNLRWNSAVLPFFLGVSASYEHTVRTPEPLALSTYIALSLDRLSGNSLHGSLQFERVDAKNWNHPAVNTGQVNPGLGDFFGAASFLNSVREAHSLGYFGQARYDFVRGFAAIYKFDWLALDWQATGDSFARHGVGFRAQLNANVYLDARYEFASVGRAEVMNSDALAAQNDFFASLRLWL